MHSRIRLLLIIKENPTYLNDNISLCYENVKRSSTNMNLTTILISITIV